MENEKVIRIFPLIEEVEDTEWLPGMLVLLSSNSTKIPDTQFFDTRISTIPQEVLEELSLLTPYLFFPFNFTTMRPVAGTQRRLLR